MWNNRVFSLRASLPLTVAALLLLSSNGWAQQELRSGKKGATNPAPVTSTSIDADHQALDVNVAGGTLGNVTISNADGAINDGVSNTIKATVLDLTNSNPLTVGIVDSSGNQISSFGGGTQYDQGTASTTTDTMTMAGCVRVDTPAVAAGVIDGDRARCMVDSTGRLWVHVGVIDGTVAVTQSGTWNIATLTSITNPVAVTGTFWQATQPVSGTVTVTDGAGALNVIVDSGTTAATQSGTWTMQPGNTANTTPWLFSISQGGNTAAVNASSQLSVNCANCSGSGVSQQDNTGFTPGTTNFVPMGGEVDDTGTTAVTENNAGVARITAQRAVHMNLRNNSGTEIGTSGNPVRVDPTGSTTQPVSGTVTVTDGAGALNVIVDSGTTTVTQATGTNLHMVCDSGCGSGTQYAEDTAHVSGDQLTLVGVVQQSATAALAADGDRTALQVDANGHLKVVNANPNLAADNSTLSTAKVPVLPGTVSTAAPTWTNGNQSALSLQTDGSVRAAITNTVTVSDGSGALNVICDSGCSGGTQYNQGTAGTATDTLSMAGAIRKDTAAADAGAIDGDRIVLSTDSVGRLRTTSADTTQPVSGTVTANAGTNLNTSALVTTTDFNSAFGTAGTADSQVMSVQGIASMTPLLANPGTATNWGVYVEDNAETAGGNLSMVGTVRRDTAATSSNASGDNSTLNTDASGLLWTRTIDPCSSAAKTFLAINISTATTTEITPSLAGASTNYYVCSLVLVTAGANNIALTDDDTDNCASVTSGLAGGTTSGSGFNMAANTGMTFGNGMGSVFKTAGTNRVICLVTSAAVQLSGTMSVVAAP